MSLAAVVCQELQKAFAGEAVIRGLSFSVAPGEILAILGPSGCGKTTTLRLIAGFEQLDSGQIDIAGRIVAAPGLHLAPEKRRAGMVFQDYAIFPHLNVRQNVAFGLARGRLERERAQAMLEFVGLGDQGDRMPHELSGGQQQRVALARALAPEPVVLLLDEPFSNLDAALRLEVRQEVRGLLKQSKMTAIFVTHDQEEALFIGDRVAIMRAGRLEQIGTPERVYHVPETRFVAGFLGQTDFLLGEVTASGVATSLGLLEQAIGAPPGSAVEVAVRPDDLTLLPDEPPNGVIVGRQFLGIAYLYQVRLDSGQIVRCWQPHTARFESGSAVAVRFKADHPLRCFVGGRLAA